MKQTNKKLLEMPYNEINRLVTEEFLQRLKEMVRIDVVDTEMQFAEFVGTARSAISRLKTDKNRYITLDVICKAVNLLGMNANSIFVVEGKEKENVIREDVNINSSGSGMTNNVVKSKVGKIIQGNVINGNNHGEIYTAEKIIQGLPKEYQKDMKIVLESIRESTTEISSLKKIIDGKDKEINKVKKEKAEIEQKYLQLLEKTAGMQK